MLVLSRHRDESIIIPVPGGPRLRITVIDIRGDKVRIGVEAPPDVPVDREEIYEAKMRSKRLESQDRKSYNDASRNGD